MVNTKGENMVNTLESKIKEVEGLVEEYQKCKDKLAELFERYEVPKELYISFLSGAETMISMAKVKIMLSKRLSTDPSMLEEVLDGLEVEKDYFKKRMEEMKYLLEHSNTRYELIGALSNVYRQYELMSAISPTTDSSSEKPLDNPMYR